MRELEKTEINMIAGAAWWSPSNILGFIHNVTHSSNETKPGEWNVPEGNGSGMGTIFGIGAVVVAGVVAAAGLAGLIGISALAKRSN